MKTLNIATRRLLVLMLALGVLSSFAQADDALRDMQGNITSLEQQKEDGKWTVVMIWASNCHVCNAESGQYSEFHTAHADKDAKIIGMSIDGEEGKVAAEDFIERNGVIFPNLIGDVQTVATWYQMQTGEAFRATPTFVVFGPDGEIRAAQPGAVPPSVVEKFMSEES
jgi:peroxiredoxin